MIQLFKKHSTGAIGWWLVRKENPFIVYEYCVVEGGAIVSNKEEVLLNNSGRNWDQQADLMMLSRATRKAQKGYKASRILAEQSEYSTAADGSILPMKAMRIEKVKRKPNKKMWVQPKLNGHRCTVTRNADGSMTARSGAGNTIHTIDHVLEVIKPHMPEDLPVDGEIYVHGWPLQYIGSRIKKKHDDSHLLEFISYDVCDTSLGYADRLDQLVRIIKPAFLTDRRTNLVKTVEVSSIDDAWNYFDQFRSMKYEGAMLRYDGMGYQPGIRSSWILKMKAQIDMEFKVVGMYMSQRGIPMLQLVTDQDAHFDCPAPGDMPSKHALLQNQANVIGKMMTCEFAEWTNDGVPFHCVALQLREDV